MFSYLYILKEFHEFHMAFLVDEEKKSSVGDLIDDKEFVFDTVQTEFKEITSDYQTTFIVYEGYNKSLKVILYVVINISIFMNIFLNLKIIIQVITITYTGVLLSSISLRRKKINHHF